MWLLSETNYKKQNSADSHNDNLNAVHGSLLSLNQSKTYYTRKNVFCQINQPPRISHSEHGVYEQRPREYEKQKVIRIDS